MKNEIIICVGISGSGKSSWSTQFIKDNPNYLRINRDDIRKTLVGNLDGYYQRSDLGNIEELVNQIEESLFYKLFNHGHYNVIFDNTNLKVSYINRWLKIFERYELLTNDITNFKFKLFDISLEEARDRVGLRDFKELIDKETEFYGYDFDKVDYIDKQWLQYKEIKRFIHTNYKDKII